VAYKVEFARRAAQQLKDLPRNVQQRLRTKIDALAQNPRPQGSVKLSGNEDLYRIRVGHYRVIYAIQDRELIVVVVKVGSRQDVYRGLGDV
jgi:mRNA interferase RelE/StbE